MGNFFSRNSMRKSMRKSYYAGVDTMQLLDNNTDTDQIWETLNETKLELSNTNNVIKYIEEQTSSNIKLISTDLHHISENFLNLKGEYDDLKKKLDEVIQINRILANKVSSNSLTKENNDENKNDLLYLDD